ncbi:hypothetical protein TTHERM_00745730 (macronuclear) [Tetrahymena thermophila SB210]|uniref:Uncharacterized protein n=1 Tax=Tetrahymena thermophila (strain SB210) TaxID=312017 RepID=Q239V5_TETTS|nr:hypothetical protein TTHERM_00745730 [Tetrahymena thermophila SB210]EAR93303.2 hypothetical protein TTHERM_00745730 [Tetrahymena thermophila SB210]|eukprot:XP_001013548.2 hypothetical protein TTHERM_00745730 [Tetrahymena thermophila SB210]
MEQYLTKQNKYQSESMHSCQINTTEEQKKSFPESNQIQSDYKEGFQSVSQKLDSIFNRLDTDLNQKSVRLLKSRYRHPINSCQGSKVIESCPLNGNGDESENSFVNSTYQKTDKSEQSSQNNCQNKKVSFCNQNKATFNNSYEKDTKVQFQGKQEVNDSNLDTSYEFSFDEGKKKCKSILKRSQTYEIKSQKADDEDDYGTNQLKLDFCGIEKERVVQYLLDNETCNSKCVQQYFFSEMVTKISSSGQTSERIIFITRNSFYVLQDIYSYKHIQKFEISEISKIIIYSQYKNICSIVISNQFQLNLKINHLDQFTQFILTICKDILKASIPIIYNQNSLQPNINQNNNIKSKTQSSFFNNKTKEFYIYIQKITNNIQHEGSQMLGLIQFIQNGIFIMGLDKSQELNRLTQVQPFQINQQQTSVIFKSIKNQDHLFLVKLKDNQNFQIFVNQIQNICQSQTN